MLVRHMLISFVCNSFFFFCFCLEFRNIFLYMIIWAKTHYARRYMFNGMTHIQWSSREFARSLDKFWFVESWFLDTRPSEGSYIAQWKTTMTCHSAMYLPSLDRLVSNLKKQLSTNQNLSNAHTVRIREMTVRYVSFRWKCIALHSVHS